MWLEVSDEVGTEGLGILVIEECDTAKEFSIKAPCCAHRLSALGCLLGKPWRSVQENKDSLATPGAALLVWFHSIDVPFSC